MKTIKTIITVILTFYFVPTLLAGMDIYRGNEPDLSSEWDIIFIFLVMVCALLVVNIAEILKLKKPE